MNLFKLLIAIVFLTISSGCDTIEVKCERIENGVKVVETVIVQRHPEKQYQQAVKTTEANMKATVEVLDKVKIADLDAGLKQQITGLRDKLDQFSSRTQDILKASYDALQTTPCDSNVRKSNSELIAGLAKENAALEKLKTELLNAAKKGNFGGVDDEKISAIIEEYKRNNDEALYKQ